MLNYGSRQNSTKFGTEQTNRCRRRSVSFGVKCKHVCFQLLSSKPRRPNMKLPCPHQFGHQTAYSDVPRLRTSRPCRKRGLLMANATQGQHYAPSQSVRKFCVGLETLLPVTSKLQSAGGATALSFSDFESMARSACSASLSQHRLAPWHQLVLQLLAALPCRAFCTA